MPYSIIYAVLRLLSGGFFCILPGKHTIQNPTKSDTSRE